MAVGQISIEAILDVKQFNQGISNLKNEVGGIGSKLGGAVSNFRNFGGAVTGAVGVLAGFAGIATAGAGIAILTQQISESVVAFNESEKAVSQLEAVLKSTKGVAGITADEAKNLAGALQQTTAFSDEQVLSAENLLLTFTNIGQDVFPEATKTVLDMSQALGQDLKSSSIQLGKALQDPIQGVTALRRVGVNFNEEQQKTIKRLVETGKTMEAQKLIIQELKTEFGGSAEAFAKTAEGQKAIAANLVGEQQEQLGKLISDFQLKITPFISNLKIGLIQGVLSVLPNILKGLEAAFQTLGVVIQNVTDFFTKNQIGIALLQGAMTGLKVIIEILTGPLGKIIILVAAIAAGFFLLSNPIFLTIAAITAIVTAIGFLINNFDMMKQKVIEFTQTLIDNIINFVIAFFKGQFIDDIVFVFTYIVGFLTSTFIKLIGTAVQFAIDFVAGIIKFLYELPGKILKVFIDTGKSIDDGFKGFIEKAIEFGKNFVKAIADGIKAAPGAIFDALRNIINSAVSGFSSGASAGLNLASGGLVNGRGNGVSDSIPAMLSNGEFVVNAEATRRFLGLLEAINSGRFSHNLAKSIGFQGFASGGLVINNNFSSFNGSGGDLESSANSLGYGLAWALKKRGVNWS